MGFYKFIRLFVGIVPIDVGLLCVGKYSELSKYKTSKMAYNYRIAKWICDSGAVIDVVWDYTVVNLDISSSKVVVNNGYIMEAIVESWCSPWE